jgi:hypothetical protein
MIDDDEIVDHGLCESAAETEFERRALEAAQPRVAYDDDGGHTRLQRRGRRALA